MEKMLSLHCCDTLSEPPLITYSRTVRDWREGREGNR